MRSRYVRIYTCVCVYIYIYIYIYIYVLCVSLYMYVYASAGYDQRDVREQPMGMSPMMGSRDMQQPHSMMQSPEKQVCVFMCVCVYACACTCTCM